MSGPHRGVGVLALVLLLGGACSSNTHRLKTTSGTSTTASAPSTAVPAASTTTPTTATTARNPATTKVLAPPATLAATTPTGPPPPASSGRGAIAGRVSTTCGSDPGSGCRSQGGAGGETVQVKTGATVVASTLTAADGTYRVEVPAGTYDVALPRTGQSRRVVVNAGQTVAVDFTEP